MIKISFTTTEIEELRHLSLNHPHHFVRKKALSLLLKSQNIPHSRIAKTMNLCSNTIHDYFENYLKDGMKFVTGINFRKPQSKLVPFEDIIRDYLKKTPPRSTAQACAEIYNLTGVCLKGTQMRAYLKSLGVAYRKVGSVPAKADIIEQKRFKEEELEPRLKEAKAGLRTVFFWIAYISFWGLF